MKHNIYFTFKKEHDPYFNFIEKEEAFVTYYYHPIYPIIYLEDIYVLPQHRNKHIARNLFKELEQECKSNNINCILARLGKEKPKYLYEKYINIAGFVYESETENEYILKKELE